MARDRYSDDHTIEVIGDTQTVTINDNLVVSGTITAGSVTTPSGNQTVSGDLEVTGNLTVNGNADITGDLTVDDITADEITADRYRYTNKIEVLKWIPTAVLQATANQSTGPTSGTDTLISVNGGDTFLDYPGLLVGHSTNPTWWITFQLDPFLPDGVELTEVIFVVDNVTVTGSPVGGFEYRGRIETVNVLGATGTTTTEGDDTTFGPGTTGLRSLINFTFSPPIEIDTSELTGNFYRIKLEQIESVEANTLAIYKMGVKYTIDSVEQGLNIDF